MSSRIWFKISDRYAIKRLMPLSGIKRNHSYNNMKDNADKPDAASYREDHVTFSLCSTRNHVVRFVFASLTIAQ